MNSRKSLESKLLLFSSIIFLKLLLFGSIIAKFIRRAKFSNAYFSVSILTEAMFTLALSIRQYAKVLPTYVNVKLVLLINQNFIYLYMNQVSKSEIFPKLFKMSPIHLKHPVHFIKIFINVHHRLQLYRCTKLRGGKGRQISNVII